MRFRGGGLRVKLTFNSRKLEKLCSSEKLLVAEFGKTCARKIARRLLVLEAAECLADVPHIPPDRRHQLSGRRKGQFAVDAQHPFRIIFLPNHNPMPLKEDGGIDLTRVTAVEILEIEDYH